MRDRLNLIYDKAVVAARFGYEHHFLTIAIVVFLSVIFFPRGESHALTVLYVLVLTLAALGLLSPGRKGLANSVLLWACAAYLGMLMVASLLDPASPAFMLRYQAKASALILLFLLITGSLVSAYPNFARHLFIWVGCAVAISALINIYLFFSYLVPPGRLLVQYLRLKTSIGMPDYANSTNISATYAVFLIGTLLALVQARLKRWRAVPVVMAVFVLLAGVLATQSRSAIIAVAIALGLTVLTTGGRRHVVRILPVIAVLGAVPFAVPEIGQILFARGTGYRFEVWEKFLHVIAGRPIFGYGVFNPITITLDAGESLDQAHNLVLSGWLRGGIFAALAMALLLAGSLWWAWRYWTLTRNNIPLCVMAAIGTAGMFDYQLLPTYPTWPWVTFWLPFGLCVGAEMASRNLIRAKNSAAASPLETTSAAGKDLREA